MSKVPLNDLPRQKLCEIVEEYGRYISDDPQRCKGLLLDYCAEYRREVNILMDALEEQVAAELLMSSERESYEGLLSRLSWRLCENYGIAEDFARWGVESWALALGIISEETLKTLPLIEIEPGAQKQFAPEWGAIGTSVRGDIHARENLPNKDHISWQQDGKTGIPLVLAVADGHGDEQHFRSDVGARLAVQAALHVIQLFCATTDDTTIQESIKDLPCTIVAKWKEYVEAHWLQNGLTEEETTWLTESKNAAIQQAVNTNHTLPYDTTLLAALVAETFILYLQLGDGDILTVLETGKVVRPLPVDKRLLANQTTSLCSVTATQEFRSSFQKRSDEQPALILLSTDGYANSFRDEAGFLQVGTDILSMMRIDGVDAVATRMRGWLKKATQAGSGDDITLGILCRMSAVEQKANTAKSTSQQSVRIENDSSPHPVKLPESEVRSHTQTIRRDSIGEGLSTSDTPKKTTIITSRSKLIVSQDGNGYTSINEAIKDAGPDTRIEVYPGTYNEGIILM